VILKKKKRLSSAQLEWFGRVETGIFEEYAHAEDRPQLDVAVVLCHPKPSDKQDRSSGMLRTRNSSSFFLFLSPFNSTQMCVFQKVLNHDDPVTTRNYNTTSDLLQLLQNPEYLPFFQVQSCCLCFASESNALPQQKGEKRIFIALCFKNVVPCVDDDGSLWISLIDDFYNAAVSIIKEYNLNCKRAFLSFSYFFLEERREHPRLTCSLNQWSSSSMELQLPMNCEFVSSSPFKILHFLCH
jgi:hypothetical protein